jgi:hypothetical protein
MTGGQSSRDENKRDMFCLFHGSILR